MNANDHVPMVNIMPFGFCKKGMPCMPLTPVAWVDVNKKHIIDGAPALTEDSKLACAHGGVISIVPLDAGSAEEGKMNENAESAVEKIGLALKMAGAIADCIDVFSPGGLVKMAGKKGAAKNLKGGENKGKGSGGGKNKKAGASKDGAFKRSQSELDELAADPAHGGKIDAKSIREREVGLGTEARGDIPGPIKRDPTGRAEFIDASGQKWDVKGFNSNFKPSKGGYTLEKSMKNINNSLQNGENVIVDTAKMSSKHVEELKNAVNSSGLGDKVIFW